MNHNLISTLTRDTCEALRQAMRGQVITPDDAGYDAARTNWNLSYEQRPAVIVVARDAADISAALRFARQAGLGVAVKATGHGITRPADGALLIVTAAMRAITIDAAAHTARIEAGALWGDVLAQAQQHGLAPLLGSSPNVGAVGYTLGGGMGWLARRYGLAADSVVSFDVVLADGTITTASTAQHADLFWALHGGGGAFAVVSAMTIWLFPVTTVFAGNLYYPAELAAEVYARFREWTAHAPGELTSAVTLMNFPPLPELPPFLSGQSVVIVRGCYAGPVEQCRALVQPWLDWRTPLLNAWQEMPFSAAASISNDPVDPMPARSSGEWLRELTDDVARTLIERTFVAGGPPPIVMAEVRHAGGAIARSGDDGGPIGHRDANYVLNMVGATPTPEAVANFERYAAQTKAELGVARDGIYLNFVEGREARDRIAEAYAPGAYERLRAIKREYDPDGTLGYSANIR